MCNVEGGGQAFSVSFPACAATCVVTKYEKKVEVGV